MLYGTKSITQLALGDWVELVELKTDQGQQSLQTGPQFVGIGGM